MKYESNGEASNFEINMEVAKLMPFLVNSNQSKSIKSKADSVMVNDIVGEWEFNPCENWAEAGPIIQNNKIELVYDAAFTRMWTATHVKHMDEYDVDMIGCNDDKSPLRAAMITFLAMNDVRI